MSRNFTTGFAAFAALSLSLIFTYDANARHRSGGCDGYSSRGAGSWGSNGGGGSFGGLFRRHVHRHGSNGGYGSHGGYGSYGRSESNGCGCYGTHHDGHETVYEGSSQPSHPETYEVRREEYEAAPAAPSDDDNAHPDGARTRTEENTVPPAASDASPPATNDAGDDARTESDANSNNDASNTSVNQSPGEETGPSVPPPQLPPENR